MVNKERKREREDMMNIPGTFWKKQNGVQYDANGCIPVAPLTRKDAAAGKLKETILKATCSIPLR